MQPKYTNSFLNYKINKLKLNNINLLNIFQKHVKYYNLLRFNSIKEFKYNFNKRNFRILKNFLEIKGI